MSLLKIYITLLSLVIYGYVFPQCPAPKAFTNPVIPGFFPDPSVVRVGDDYYCVNSTFEYFPAIVISHSKDLVNWKQIGHVFSKSEDLDLSYFFDGMGIWAPDISYYNRECTQMAEEPRWLETEGRKSAPEGPHMLKKDDWYFLIMAVSGGLFNGHHMLVARSKSVYGPFENSPNNPYLTQRDPHAFNFHQGHGKIFNTQNDEWWTMVLSQHWLPGEIRGQKRGISPLGRETSLERITWSEDGWPVANGGKGQLDANIRPNLPWMPVFNPSGDEFSGKLLGIQWVFRKNPVYENVSLTEKKGYLRMYSGDFDIDTILGRNLIVQWERWLQFTASTKLAFLPESREPPTGASWA